MSQTSSGASALRSRVPRIAGAAVERARLTVVPRTRAVRAARVPFVLFISLILLLGVVGLLMFNTSMQQASFTMETYQERAVSLAAREEQLTAELEDLRDPETLAQRAQRLGMVQPACTPYLRLGSGKVEGAKAGDDACAAPGRPLDLGSAEPPRVPSVLDPPDTVIRVAPPATGEPATTGTGDGDKKKSKKNDDR